MEEKYLKIIDDLKKRVEQLEVKRSYQWDIAPGAVKNRHLAEPNSYVYSGLAANRPTSGVDVTLGYSIYWAYDTGVLSIWNGTTWLSETFT